MFKKTVREEGIYDFLIFSCPPVVNLILAINRRR